MEKKISEKEFESIIQLPTLERYSYSLKLIADCETVWGLVDPLDGKWCMSCDDNGNEHIPFWPHSKYAETSVEGCWTGAVPKSINLDDFIKIWLPGMVRDKLKVSLFPTPSQVQISVAPAQLLKDLVVYCNENFNEEL